MKNSQKKIKLVVKPKVFLKPVAKAAPAPELPTLVVTGPAPPKGESDFAPKLDGATLKKQAEESASF